MHAYYMPFLSDWLLSIIWEKQELYGTPLTYARIMGCNFIMELSHMIVRHFEKRGIEMGFWVINNIEDFHKALQFPISGIHTDLPEFILGYMDEIGMV